MTQVNNISLSFYFSNQCCLLNWLCSESDYLVHFCTLFSFVCLTMAKSTMTCLFWGDTFPISAYSASFLAITWYSSSSGGWVVIRALEEESSGESGLEFQVPLASECLCWPIARTFTVVTCLISRAGRLGGRWAEVTHATHSGLLVCVCVWIWE